MTRPGVKEASYLINTGDDDQQQQIEEKRPLIDPSSNIAPPEVIEKEEKKEIKNQEIMVLILIGLVIGFGSLNKVAYKIMSQPMGNYSFFLSLFNSVAYIILYYSILFFRYYTGRVTKAQMLYPYRRMEAEPQSSSLKNKIWNTVPALKYFVIIGFMDSLGNILGLIAAPYLTGQMISLVQQTMVIFSIGCAMIMLGTRYNWIQYASAVLVIAGAVIAFIPQLRDPAQGHSPLSYALLMSLSNLPSAISFTVKEMIFRKEKNLELFVVNSTGSLFQLIWFPVMIPITILLKQTNGLPLNTYIKYGFMCFAGVTPEFDAKTTPGRCSADPWPYFVYIVFNLAFNISLLLLLKRASALQGFMAIKAVLPVSVFLFLIKWPLIGSSDIDWYTGVSLVVILAALGLYRYGTVIKAKKDKERKI